MRKKGEKRGSNMEQRPAKKQKRQEQEENKGQKIQKAAIKNSRQKQTRDIQLLEHEMLTDSVAAGKKLSKHQRMVKRIREKQLARKTVNDDEEEESEGEEGVEEEADRKIVGSDEGNSDEEVEWESDESKDENESANDDDDDHDDNEKKSEDDNDGEENDESNDEDGSSGQQVNGKDEEKTVKTGAQSEQTKSEMYTVKTNLPSCNAILTDNAFSSLEDKVSEQTLRAIAKMGFTHMTEIQHKSIPYLLEGRRLITSFNGGLIFAPVDEFDNINLEVMATAGTSAIWGFTVDKPDDRLYYGFYSQSLFQLRSVKLSVSNSIPEIWKEVDFGVSIVYLINDVVFNNTIYGFNNGFGFVTFTTTDLTGEPQRIKTDLLQYVGQPYTSFLSFVDDMTIIDDVTTFSMKNDSFLRVSESDKLLKINVLRNGFRDDVVSVDLYVVPVSSMNDNALYLERQRVTFLRGQISKAVGIAIYDDQVVEEDGLFELRLDNPVNGLIKGITFHNLMLEDDDYALSFEYTNYDTYESSNDLFLNVLREGNLKEAISFDINTASIEAIAGEDFPIDNPIAVANFPSGAAQVTVRIPVIDDDILETLETFQIALDIPAETAENDYQVATISIHDNEATFSLSKSYYNVREEEQKCDITVVRNGYAGQSATVVVNTIGVDEDPLTVSAKAGVDFIAVHTVLQFGVHETRKNISIPIVDDIYTEPVEAFKVILSESQLPLAEPLSAFVGISDIDNVEPTSTYSLERTTYDVYENDGQVEVVVIRSGTLIQPGRVQLLPNLAGGSGSNLDFEDLIFNVQFEVHEESVSVTVRIKDDTIVEDDETFLWELSRPVGGDVASQYQTAITIRDDDTEYLFGSNHYEIAEGEGTVLKVSVVRRGDVRGSGSVLLTSVEGSAKRIVDFMQDELTVLFASNEVVATANIYIINDILNEADEDFRLFMTPLQEGSQVDTIGIMVTIKDDDPKESLSSDTRQAVSTSVIVGVSVGGGAVLMSALILLGVFIWCVIATKSPSVTTSSAPRPSVPAISGGYYGSYKY